MTCGYRLRGLAHIPATVQDQTTNYYSHFNYLIDYNWYYSSQTQIPQARNITVGRLLGSYDESSN